MTHPTTTVLPSCSPGSDHAGVEHLAALLLGTAGQSRTAQAAHQTSAADGQQR